MSHEWVLVSGEILQEGPRVFDNYFGKSFLKKTCAHDLDKHIAVRISTDQWEHVVAKSSRFLVVGAVYQNGILDTTGSKSGVAAACDARTGDGDESKAVVFELVSGGFSGWTQAMRRLTQLGHPFEHKAAIDIDQICCETFCKSHGIERLIGPSNFTWGRDQLPPSVMIQGDVSEHGWLHLLSNVLFDVGIMSPPCPAWSFATSLPGLLREDGRLSLHAWGVMSLIAPRVVVMEMVAGMKDHPHWPLVRQFIQWAGFSIRYSRSMNLAEVTPQQRNRLILIATRDHADVQPHICVPWPVTQRQTMESYMNIMELDEPWLTQTKVDPYVLQTYLDPAMLPKSLDQRGRQLKRARKDVEEYRIKHPHSVFGCIMSNYSYGHLLPLTALQHSGLYGTLLALPSGLRFLSVPEILISLTALMPCWLPDDHRAIVKMLGNAVATPHALVGLTNALAFIYELSGVEIQELQIEALSKRMTSQNLKWSSKWGGFSFEIDEDICAPTMLMHVQQQVVIRSPVDLATFFAERDVNVLAALRALLGIAMPNEIFFLPGGDLEARIRLLPQLHVDNHEIQLFTGVPTSLNIPSNAFSTAEANSPCIIVLTKAGPHVVRRDHGMTIQDVTLIVDHNFGIRCTHLVGVFGEKHPPLMICPDAVIAMDYESFPDDLEIFDFIDVQVDDQGLSFVSDWTVLKDFSTFLQRTTLSDIMQALGWMLVVDAQSAVNDDIKRFMVVRRPSTLAISLDDLVYCLAIHLFLTKIRLWTVVGEAPRVRCKVKLWHVWIWDALIDPAMSLSLFENEWNKISELFKFQKPWRFIANGRQLNPEWPLSGFVNSDEMGNSEITIFMILGLRGGGGLVKLLSSEDVEVAGNFRDLAHLESSNYEAAMTVALTQVMEFCSERTYHDITEFLELFGAMTEGLYSINGPFQLLKRFLDFMKRTGIEKAIAKCGWIIACHFEKVLHPEIAQIIFVQKPRGPTTSLAFIRCLLRSALVFLGMPKPVQCVDAVLTKVKMWNATIYHGLLPRMFPMQDLLDLWDQASTVVGDHFEVRMVSHVGVVNPDFALKNYSRCGSDDKTKAVITFVGTLRGGGPSPKDPANVQALNVQQKNALAGFLLAQGADLKECVSFIESIIRNAGANAVASVLNQKAAAKKWDGLMELSSALHIPLPQLGEKMKLAKKKMQKKFQSHSKALPAHIPVESLVVQSGFLRNADESECQQIYKIAPNVSGAVLMRFQDAKPWLERQAILSQDELAVIVIGPCGHGDSLDCCPIQVPVNVSGEPCILKACLHQVGARHVTFVNDDDSSIPGNETVVVCLTAVKDEMQKECWESVIQAPVRQMLKLLGDEVADIPFIAPPWGRSFQRNSKKIAPELAHTVQFHARINQSDLRAYLRSSGNGGVYTCPKTEDKKISSDYLVVWLKVSDVDMAVHLSQCENHFGLVRSFKGDSQAKGIRFVKADFPAAFAKLRPHDKMPNMISINHFFRVEPVPTGSTAEHIQSWIDLHGWKAKPVRPLGANTWLCGAERKFEGQFPQWNNKPVLVKWVQNRSDQEPVILAGNVQRLLSQASGEIVAAIPTDQNSQEPDPWGNWIKNHGGTGLAQPGVAFKTPLITSPTVQPPRRVEAPIEDKFQRQDELIQQVRLDSQKEIADIKDNVLRLEKALEAQKIVVETNMETTASEFDKLRVETGHQFQSMADLFKDSLTQAISNHDGTMAAQFAELKQMIAAGSSRGSPATKKQKQNSANGDGDL